MKKIILTALVLTSAIITWAMTKADIFNESNAITWLGLDFSQVRFIGQATQWKDAGEITPSAMRDKYFPGWNDLFVSEPKKFNVADAVHRSDVQYATEVTEKSNGKISSKDFFTDDAGQYQLVDEQKVSSLVKKYNFQGKTGIGLMFFVEGMNRGKEEASAWVTFVDMNSKTVLLTVRETGKAGGFGFRNYWAKTFANMLKSVQSDYKKWKK